MINMEETLRKIAVEISENKCGEGSCPCKVDCEVYSDKDCIDRIMNWFKSVAEI